MTIELTYRDAPLHVILPNRTHIKIDGDTEWGFVEVGKKDVNLISDEGEQILRHMAVTKIEIGK